MKKIVVVLSLLLLSGCSNTDTTQAALEEVVKLCESKNGIVEISVHTGTWSKGVNLSCTYQGEIQ